MIRVLYRNSQDGIRHEASVEQLPDVLAACRGSDGVVWVDLYQDIADVTLPEYAAQQAQIEWVLREVFGFHPLSVDDALIESHVPKLDDWDTYLYLVLHAVVFDHELDEVDTREVDVFVGRHYLVTYHVEDLPALEREWRTVLRDERHSRHGPDFMLYELCDSLANDYLPCMDAIDEALDKVQDDMFESPAPDILSRAFKIKRAVSHLRRILSPQREVLNKLARDDYGVIDERERIYFRDVYDHYVRMADLNESLRDIAAGSLDMYLSVTANRTNEVMKTLTIVTTLFMPLTFITGFFGMNFFGGTTEVPLRFDPLWLFMAMGVLSVAVPVAMVAFFRRRGWW